MVDETVLAVTISRDGDDLRWEVANVGTTEVGAFLLVPSIVDGRLSFGVDTAWIERDDEGTILLRKANAERPEDQFADAVPSGAVRLRPGDRRSGRVTLGGEVALRPAYAAGGGRVTVDRVVLEVGWVGWPLEPPEMLDWEGQAFAYLDTGDESPQLYARSAPLVWAS
jgi:hypothetical protein